MTDRTEHPIHFQPGPTRRAFLGAGALTLLGLAAPPLVRPAAAQTPKRGGTLIVAADVSPPGLDPQKSAAAHSWMIAEHVYSNLLRRDPKMNIVGDLAESWQVVSDTTFVFKLRKGVVVAPRARPRGRRREVLVRADARREDGVALALQLAIIDRDRGAGSVHRALRHQAAVRPLLLVPGHAPLLGHRPARHRREARRPPEDRLRHRALRARAVRSRQHRRPQAEPELLRVGPALSRRHRVPDHPGRGRAPGRAARGHRPLPLVRRPAHRSADPGRARRRAP